VADLSASNDSFITAIYKDIAKKVWNSRLIKADYDDDIKGIDYYCVAGNLQVKELKSGSDRGCFDDYKKWPFETAAKNRNGTWQGGWIYHTEADFLIFIRTIRETGEWKCSIYDWKKLQPYILANIERSWINRWGTAKNKMFSKKDIEEYLIAELNN
jgi:hypothetical protein